MLTSTDVFIKKKNFFFYNKVFFYSFYRAVILFSYLISQLYTILGFITSFYFILNLPFVSKNFFFFKLSNSLKKKLRYIRKYKKRNAFFPEVERTQIRAAFKFIKRYNKRYKKRLFNKSKYSSNMIWNFNSISFLKFQATKKVKKRRIRFFKKHHTFLFKNFFRQLKSNFFITRIRKKKILTFFSTFKKKGYKKLGFFFTFNIVKLLIRVFSFFDKFFIRKLITSGFVFLNNNRVNSVKVSAGKGSLVRLCITENFSVLYYTWISSQRRYIRFLYKNLFHHFRARAAGGRTKNALRYSTIHNNLYKKVPSWVEVNYLALSFFIIKNPLHFSYRSYYFNPFLFRLLFF